MNVWAEVSTSRHQHGGNGWEFGTCIWSPAKDRRGSVGHYGIMLAVQPGDFIINCLDSKVRGTSFADAACRQTVKGPPNPKPWGYTHSFFRIDLRDFRPEPDGELLGQIATKHRDAIAADMKENRQKYYLYSYHQPGPFHPQGKVVLAQGRFLARVTPILARLLLTGTESLDRLS